MKTLVQRLVFGSVLAVVGCVSVSSADAAHDSYCYQGTCHNFHGESHVISALQLMDDALLADCLQQRAQTTVAAQRQVMMAFREFCQYRAKHELIQAKIELSRFIGSGDVSWLDAAASHLNAALVIEQQVHVQSVHTGRTHGGHGHVNVPVAPRYQQPIHAGQGSRSHGQGSRSYIRLGGPRFSFGFGF